MGNRKQFLPRSLISGIMAKSLELACGRNEPIAVCGMFVGCGEAVEAPPKTYKVSGKVTYKGQPVSKATVTFQALDAGDSANRRPAIGEIQPDGTYQLSTFNPDDGALPGDYQVVITSFDNEPTAEEHAEGAERKSAIPEKYSNAVTSGLMQKIDASSSAPITANFELTD